MLVCQSKPPRRRLRRWRQKLPVGVRLCGNPPGRLYYIDKTGLIRDLLRDRASEPLHARRFGKTLNMSMLKCFFEIGTDASLFDNLAIAGKDLCEGIPGQVPRDFLTLEAWTAQISKRL